MTATNVGNGRGTGQDGTAQPLAIGLRGVHKNFGSVEAVKGIDLDIASGEIVAFLGPNGAGKTSTIDIILGLFSAVMQTGGLLKDLTVLETAQYTASLFAHSRPVKEVLERAGITA